MLFDAICAVNDAIHAESVRQHAAGELAERTFSDCRGKFGGCFLGRYRRDKTGAALIEMLKRQKVVPAHASCPLDE